MVIYRPPSSYWIQLRFQLTGSVSSLSFLTWWSSASPGLWAWTGRTCPGYPNQSSSWLRKGTVYTLACHNNLTWHLKLRNFTLPVGKLRNTHHPFTEVLAFLVRVILLQSSRTVVSAAAFLSHSNLSKHVLRWASGGMVTMHNIKMAYSGKHKWGYLRIANYIYWHFNQPFVVSVSGEWTYDFNTCNSEIENRRWHSCSYIYNLWMPFQTI